MRRLQTKRISGLLALSGLALAVGAAMAEAPQGEHDGVKKSDIAYEGVPGAVYPPGRPKT